MSLRIRFLGAVDTVTGSCSLIHFQRSDQYFLADCGMYQGTRDLEERNRDSFPFEPSRLSGVFLTHAHVDHCGLLPHLVAKGFEGPIYCTEATALLTHNALCDASRICDLYDKKAVNAVNKLYHPVDKSPEFRWGYYQTISQDFSYSFIRTSHVLGSVAIEMKFVVGRGKRVNIAFSGDVGPCAVGIIRGNLIKPRQYPNPATDYLVCESTYGDRQRNPDTGLFTHRVNALAKALADAFARGSHPVIIIPSFSLQRTQELVADLCYVFQRLMPQGHRLPRVVIDSKLAHYQTRIFRNELSRRTQKGTWFWLDQNAPLFADLQPPEIEKLLESLFSCSEGERVLGEPGAQWRLLYGSLAERPDGEPLVLVSASGTGLAGPVVEHLSKNLENPAATVLLVGYQPQGSPGAQLKALFAKSPNDRSKDSIKVNERSIAGEDIKAGLVDLSSYYSGHADRDGLVDFVFRDEMRKSLTPVTVFLNHGTAFAREQLKERLETVAAEKREGYRKLREVITPTPDDGWFDLLRHRWEDEDTGTSAVGDEGQTRALLMEILQNQREILQLLKSR